MKVVSRKSRPNRCERHMTTSLCQTLYRTMGQAFGLVSLGRGIEDGLVVTSEQIRARGSGTLSQD